MEEGGAVDGAAWFGEVGGRRRAEEGEGVTEKWGWSHFEKVWRSGRDGFSKVQGRSRRGGHGGRGCLISMCRHVALLRGLPHRIQVYTGGKCFGFLSPFRHRWQSTQLLFLRWMNRKS